MEKIDFEQSLKRLDEIVSKIENESLSLEENMKLYEEAKGLIKVLNKVLKEAEEKVKELQIDEEN